MNATADETMVGEEGYPTGCAAGVSRLGIPSIHTRGEEPNAQIQQAPVQVQP
jgi:hypothetical protein